MPVIATPNADQPAGCDATPVLPGGRPADPLPVSCMNQHVIVPRTPADATTGKQLLSRIMAIDVPGQQQAVIQYTMRDPQGNVVDLSNCLCEDTDGSLSMDDVEGCPCAYKIIFRLVEYLSGGRGKEFPVEIVDAQTGKLSVTLSPDDTRQPGVYFGEFALVVCNSENEEGATDTTVLFSNRLYVVIGRNLWNNHMSSCSPAGPPSIAEVRLHLRDSQADESYLLDNVAFADEEILQAIWLPVQYWNEIPPNIGSHTTVTFPYRYHWLMAIAGYLFLTVAEQQRRNNLTYSAGGVQVNDQNREPNYEAAAKRRLDEWRAFVRMKKSELNLEMGYGSFGSDYGHFGAF